MMPGRCKVARNLQGDLPEVNGFMMQPAAMVPPDVFSQNLQALTQIIDKQQQKMDWQQDWLCHSLVTFKILKMTQEDDPEVYIKAFKRHALMTGLDKAFAASEVVYSWEKPVPGPVNPHPQETEKWLNFNRGRPRETVCFQCEKTGHFS